MSALDSCCRSSVNGRGSSSESDCSCRLSDADKPDGPSSATLGRSCFIAVMLPLAEPSSDVLLLTSLLPVNELIGGLLAPDIEPFANRLGRWPSSRQVSSEGKQTPSLAKPAEAASWDRQQSDVQQRTCAVRDSWLPALDLGETDSASLLDTAERTKLRSLGEVRSESGWDDSSIWISPEDILVRNTGGHAADQ